MTNVEQIIQVPVPEWAYEVALKICIERSPNFQNQFVTKKLKYLVRDDSTLVQHVEGVIGYMGDICACVWLGIDPRQRLRRMCLDTDLLTHRDEYDLVYKGWRIDVKTELVPERAETRILRRQIAPEAAYGCRLINETQFEQNASGVDIYLWALPSHWDPRKTESWRPVGFLRSEDAKDLCPEPTSDLFGRDLHTPAYAFPTRDLMSPERLLQLDRNPQWKGGDPDAEDQQALDRLGRDSYQQLCEKVGL